MPPSLAGPARRSPIASCNSGLIVEVHPCLPIHFRDRGCHQIFVQSNDQIPAWHLLGLSRLGSSVALRIMMAFVKSACIAQHLRELPGAGRMNHLLATLRTEMDQELDESFRLAFPCCADPQLLTGFTVLALDHSYLDVYKNTGCGQIDGSFLKLMRCDDLRRY